MHVLNGYLTLANQLLQHFEGGMQDIYQSENLVVNYGDNNKLNSVEFLKVLSEHSSCSVIIFDADQRLIHYNNRLMTFCDSCKFDRLNLDTLTRYMRKFYFKADEIGESIRQCYFDLQRREFYSFKRNGDKIKFKLIPIFSGCNMLGVVVLARLYCWIEEKKHRIEHLEGVSRNAEPQALSFTRSMDNNY